MDRRSLLKAMAGAVGLFGMSAATSPGETIETRTAMLPAAFAEKVCPRECVQKMSVQQAHKAGCDVTGIIAGKSKAARIMQRYKR